MAKDPYRYFRIEARELLEGLTEDVLLLEQGNSEDGEVLRRLLRLAHTLKGAARVVRLVQVAEEAHAVEDLLAPYRESGGALGADVVEAVLARLDNIRVGLARLDEPQPGEHEEERAPVSAAEQFESVRIGLSELDDLLEVTLQVSIALERMRTAGGTAPSSVAAGADDALVRNLEELREQVFQLRLLPAATVFPDFKRAVRDAAKSTGKGANAETLGGDLRVDAHVLSEVRGALLHLARNAVVHGIEDAKRRQTTGKPDHGLVSLRVERRGHSVAFICGDDGRGIDVQSIGRAAAERGLLDPSAAASLEHDDAIGLLMSGGLSTSDTVTEIAGRGVGLDVARESVERLKGTIEIRSSDGSGTEVEMLVPLSLSALPALAVESGGATALIPLDVVRETLRVDPADSNLAAEGESVLWEGENVPLVPLARLLGLDASRPDRGIRRTAVVLRAGHGHVALGVDRVVEVRNVVVHPLPTMSCVEPIVAGAAFDPLGRPQLVVSPSALLDSLASGQTRASEVALPEPAALPVLVIDDSLTTRMLEQSILQSAGYDVDLAVSAEDALRLARQRRYGLFIVDVEMPGMDGFQFIARAGDDPELRGIPSILVTSRGSPEDRRRGAEVGAAAYFVKSEFDQAALLDNIRRLIG